MTKTKRLIEDMYIVLKVLEDDMIDYDILNKLVQESNTEIIEMLKIQEDYEKLRLEYQEYIHMTEYMKIERGK